MKVCNRCKLSKSLDEFHVDRKNKDGRQYKCKMCDKEMAAASYQADPERRRAASRRYQAANRPVRLAVRTQTRRQQSTWLQEVKTASGCVDCGYNAHPAALDFDHLPGHVKLMRIGPEGPSASRERVEAEIAKCEVVCANCHRIRTVSRRPVT